MVRSALAPLSRTSDMKHKPFNAGNHAANDAAGKDVVLNYLRAHGVTAIENPDKYGVDIMAPRYEVERRTIHSENWPYDTVHVPERKTKFLTKDIYYVVVIHHIVSSEYSVKPSEWDTLMVCDSPTILKCGLIEVPNNSMPEGEHFYDVPIKFWTILPNEEHNVSKG